MKLKKIMASILAAAAAITCLTACKSDGDSSGNDSANDSNSTASGSVLRIGGSGPLTGDYALYGNGVKNGAQLAIDEINAAGGINGCTIEFNMQDDEAGEEKAVNAMHAPEVTVPMERSISQSLSTL